METFFFHQDIIIITANAAGEKYLIKAKSKLATTSSTGGLLLAVQRAIVTASPKGR